MIGYLKGICESVTEESILLTTGGVGYEALVPSPFLVDLKVGQEIALWIYTHVREDALQLFGFGSREDKSFFLNLIKINGVGPRLALNIMSGGTIHQISEMIESENIKALTSLPKVGKKTAEQMILALKGKLVLAKLEPKSKMGAVPALQLSEIGSALVNLGYKALDVEKVVSQFPKDLSFQEGVRQALQILSASSSKDIGLRN